MARLTRWSALLGLLTATALTLPPTASSGLGAGPARSVEATSSIVADWRSGGGASFMRVAVTRRGNLLFESPKGELLTNFDEGYLLCDARTWTDVAFAFDLPNSDGVPPRGFGSPTVVQPTPGAFPVTITRNTTDGRLRLVQKWLAPDPVEKDVTVTMTLTNVGNTSVEGLQLIRGAEAHGEFEFEFFWAATTLDSAFQWWGDNPADTEPHGLVVTGRTVGKPHMAELPDDMDLPDICGLGYQSIGPTDLPAGGYARVTHFLGTLAPGAKVSVAFVYHRL